MVAPRAAEAGNSHVVVRFVWISVDELRDLRAYNRSVRSRTAAVLLFFAPCAAALAQSPFTETVTVEIMSVDVVVLDPNGTAVTDLGPSDFEVLVDGKRVPITNFSAYGSTAGELLEVESTPSSAAPPPVVTVKQDAPPVTWLVYVDLLNTVRQRRKRALDEVENFLEQGAFRKQDKILVALFQGDAFKVVQPLTTDLSDALGELRDLSRWARASREYADVPIAQEAVGDLDQEEKERRMRVAINGLRDLTTVVDGLEGRVALFIVSGGYDLSSFPLERAARLRGVYEKVLARLTEGRITAYTVYAGVESLDGFGASAGDAQEGGPNSLARASEIAAFADETGGIAFRSVEPELTRVRADLDHYYSLGFRPPPHRQGQTLDVDVRVRREGLRVRHRNSVRSRTEEEAAQDVTMSALISDTDPPNPWGVQLRVGAMRRDRPFGYRVKVDVVVPLAKVLFIEEEGRYAGRLVFHFAVRDAHGYFRRLEQRELPLSMPLQDFGTARGKSIRYSVELVLPAGSNDLSVTVADFAGSGRSSARAPVVVRGRP